MRIAIVTDWFAPRLGGIESQLRDLSSRLAWSGHEVTVITATPGAAAPAGIDVVELDLLRLPSPPLVVSPALLPRLRRELERGWDLVHAHVSVVSPVGWAGACIARSLGVPTAATFHSILRGKALLLRALCIAAPVGASRIAWSAVSGTVARQAAWALGGNAVTVLPNGLEFKHWTGLPTDRRADRLVFVSAMRLHRKKRGHHLLRSFAAAARASAIPVQLIIVGDGPDAEPLRAEISRLGLDRGLVRAELRSWMPAVALRELYARADAFLMASVHESFGIAALEARVAGLPVIARRSGNVEFLVDRQNALLADTDDDLVARLREFMDDTVLRHRLRHSELDLRRFDWNQVIAEHSREYERAMRLAASGVRAVAPSG